MAVKTLTRDLVARHPVWGPDASEDFLIPVAPYDPLPKDAGGLLVRARLHAPNGMGFDGVIADPPGPHGIILFIDDEWVGFNKALPELASQEMHRVFALLNTEPFDLFPIRYETEFHFANEPNLSGVFQMNVQSRGA